MQQTAQLRLRFDTANLLEQWRKYSGYAHTQNENPAVFAQDHVTRELSWALVTNHGLSEEPAMTIAGKVVGTLGPLFQRGDLPHPSVTSKLEDEASAEASRWLQNPRLPTV